MKATKTFPWAYNRVIATELKPAEVRSDLHKFVAPFPIDYVKFTRRVIVTVRIIRGDQNPIQSFSFRGTFATVSKRFEAQRVRRMRFRVKIRQ